MTPILNADDFGRSSEINRAVIRAHREGVLTSASLMAGGDAFKEAVELARENPSLAVGLHVVVVDGPAVLPPERLRGLVGSDGRFPDHPVRLGLKYAFCPEARARLSAELQAQFERFAATGLPLSHVDGHQHMHMHPAVFKRVLPLARRYRAGRIRIVRDDLRLALRYDSRGAIGKTLQTIIFALLACRCRETGPSSVARTYGFLQSGCMTEDYVLAILRQLSGSAEIYFHPTEGERLNQLGPNTIDLATLLSLRVRDQMQAQGLLGGYANTFSPRRVISRGPAARSASEGTMPAEIKGTTEPVHV